MSKKGENIYKRKDGRWEGRYIRGYDTTGKSKWGYVYGKTYYEVKQKLLEKKNFALQHPTTAKTQPTTYSELLNAWLSSSKLNTKESTYARYVHLINTHIRPCLGAYQLSKVSTQLIEEYVEHLLSNGIEVPDDIEELEKEIAEMLIEAQSQKVGEYVAECIDKVMADLGYSVVGSEVLSAQKMTKQHHNYSSNSAVTVASSENGAMMLEVVGKKNEDGTNGSTAAVKADMERFCPDFQKVKQGLQQYGVILTDKKLCPPDEKYVRFVDVKKTASTNRRITARNRKKRLYNE